jgi:hypothetical protein
MQPALRTEESLVLGQGFILGVEKVGLSGSPVFRPSMSEFSPVGED